MARYGWKKSPRLFKAGWVLLAAGMLAAPASVGSQGGYQQAVVSNGGKISGQIKFDGPIPEPYVIWVTKDKEALGEKVPDDRLLISRDGKVQNVVVTLEGIAAGKAWPATNHTLENRGGRFVPHVQVARRGASLEVGNSDPVLHNTHGFQESRTVFNLALPNKGQRINQTLRRAGVIEVMCDSHDWMNGWVVVLDHPYFAITGQDGTYEITDAPPGTYKVTAWHEKLGRQQQQVTVAAAKVAQAGFTFRPTAGAGGKASAK